MTLMQKCFWIIALTVNPVMVLISYQYWSPGFWIVGVLSLYTVVGLYDLFFSRHTLNRLYPVAAYCRYGFEYIRPEIRQYFIASNTDELPFSREERSLVYRRAQTRQQEEGTVAGRKPSGLGVPAISGSCRGPSFRPGSRLRGHAVPEPWFGRCGRTRV